MRRQKSAFAAGFGGTLGCMAAFVFVAVVAVGAVFILGEIGRRSEQNEGGPYTIVSKKRGTAQTTLQVVVPLGSVESEVLKWHKKIVNSHEGNIYAAYHDGHRSPDSSSMIATGTNTSWTWLKDD